MSNQPIYVTIKDNCNVARSLTWLAKGAKWLAAGGAVNLDYDPWSCANETQRARIASAVGTGSVTMTINVLNDVGEYVSVPYCPGKTPKTAFVVDTEPRPAAKPETRTYASPAIKQTDTGSHTVVAGVNKFASKYKINAVDVTPPGGTPNAYGFAKVGDAAPEGADAGLRKAADVQDKQNEHAPAPVPESVQEPAAQPADQSDAEQFNALIADKKWTDAYKLLKAHFGEDKITFSQRSLQYVTSWEALITKYGLDE